MLFLRRVQEFKRHAHALKTQMHTHAPTHAHKTTFSPLALAHTLAPAPCARRGSAHTYTQTQTHTHLNTQQRHKIPFSGACPRFGACALCVKRVLGEQTIGYFLFPLGVNARLGGLGVWALRQAL